MKTILSAIFFISSIVSFSQNFDDLINEGRTLLGQRRYDQAFSKFNEAEKLDNKRIEAKYGAAVALSQKCWITKNESDANKAIEALKRVEKIDDKFGNLNYNFSIVYFELKKYDLALQHIEKQIENGDKKDGDLFYQRGLVLVKKDRKKEACKDFKKAEKLGAGGSAQAIEDYCN